MTYLPPDIIDNATATLSEALARTVRDMGQRRLDVATGYFAPPVWNLVGKAFEQLDAMRLLDRWGGVLVADAVGLGKTYIGLSLLERELLHKRRRGRVPRGVIICPAQLRELVWKPRLAEFGIPVVDVLSQEELGRADFDWKRYRNVDVLLVDESHNFRNPDTNRYRTLSKVITGGRHKRVILDFTQAIRA